MSWRQRGEGTMMSTCRHLVASFSGAARRRMPLFKTLSTLSSSSSSSSWLSSNSKMKRLKVVPLQVVRGLLSFGQPTVETHSEFFRNPSEVMPGMIKEEFKGRRTTLCNMVKEVSKKASQRDWSHILLIPASRKKYMTENIPYPFRQNSNFLYLSGSVDPEALILLYVTGNEQVHTMVLSDPDPMAELWDGPRTSIASAVDHYGFDQAFHMSEFEKLIGSLFGKSRNVKVWCEDREIVHKLFDKMNSKSMEPRSVESPKKLLDHMRVIKSPSEIQLMRHSCEISARAFQQAINYCAVTSADGRKPSEHQIWATIDYECRMNGADRLAYPPVVAAGPRANIIHYVFNSNKCEPKDLVLVDAGCEFFGYCSDITRTWPVSGSFTNDRHRSLYEMLLDLQVRLIGEVRPGISLDYLFQTMSFHLIKGLQELGIVRRDINLTASDKADLSLRFCPHHVSHHLGMDVHDSPSVRKNSGLQPGMVITIEPGVYIRNSSSQEQLLTPAAMEFLGTAIRIEDDVLITPGGNEVLSASCPKTVADIERWGIRSLSPKIKNVP